MAGKIVADTLEHSTAGSIATNYVVDGSAKTWGMFDGEAATSAINASLNISSITGNGNGDETISLTNAFSSVNISIVGTAAENSSTSQTAGRFFHLDEDNLSVSSPRLFCKNTRQAQGQPTTALCRVLQEET